MIVIIDYGVGNLSSIKNMLKKIGYDAIVSNNSEEILRATKLILPGVGAFDNCMEKLEASGLVSVLNKMVFEEKTPVLGVCVGVQMMLESSEEGNLPGLGWIKGEVVKFKKDRLPEELKIPHMGWTNVNLSKPSRLFNGMYDNPRFYFVHSYHLQLQNKEDALVNAHYGYDFVAGIEHDNIIGVQFHPEKSHKYGMKLFQNFVNNF